MNFIGFEREDEAHEWAKTRLGIERNPPFFRALSAVDEKGDFVCVVVLTNFSAMNVDVNIAISGKFTPVAMVDMFNAVFSLIFDILHAERATGLTGGKNKLAQNIIERFGFKKEGVMRNAFKRDEDLVLYGFLAEEYHKHKWFRNNGN